MSTHSHIVKHENDVQFEEVNKCKYIFVFILSNYLTIGMFFIISQIIQDWSQIDENDDNFEICEDYMCRVCMQTSGDMMFLFTTEDPGPDKGFISFAEQINNCSDVPLVCHALR